MHDAAEADHAAINQNEPAFEKLRACAPLLERLRNFDLRDFLLEHDVKLLEACAQWLRPGASGLCALSVRSALYDFIDDLDIEMERDLSHNELGRVLMALRKNPQETDGNKRKITVGG